MSAILGSFNTDPQTDQTLGFELFPHANDSMWNFSQLATEMLNEKVEFLRAYGVNAAIIYLSAKQIGTAGIQFFESEFGESFHGITLVKGFENVNRKEHCQKDAK